MPSPPAQTKQQRGRQGEDDALAYLLRQGLVLLARNYLCKGGELDLIMRDGASIVFVEVREDALIIHSLPIIVQARGMANKHC